MSYPCQPHPPNSDQHLPSANPASSQLSQKLSTTAWGWGQPLSHRESQGRGATEVRETGPGPAHGVSRGLSSERTSPDGEGLSVWQTRFKEKGWAPKTRRWQPVPPGPGTCSLSLSEERVLRSSSRPAGPQARMVVLEEEAASLFFPSWLRRLVGPST